MANKANQAGTPERINGTKLKTNGFSQATRSLLKSRLAPSSME